MGRAKGIALIAFCHLAIHVEL